MGSNSFEFKLSVQPIPEETRLEIVMGMEIRIMDGQSQNLFSNEPFEKRPAMTIQDSESHSDDHFKSRLFWNGLYYVDMFCFSCPEEKIQYPNRKKADSPDFIPPPTIYIYTCGLGTHIRMYICRDLVLLESSVSPGVSSRPLCSHPSTPHAVCVCVCVLVCTHTHTHKYTTTPVKNREVMACICDVYDDVCVRVRSCMRKNGHKHVCTHKYKCVCMHTRTHTHIYIQVHKHMCVYFLLCVYLSLCFSFREWLHHVHGTPRWVANAVWTTEEAANKSSCTDSVTRRVILLLCVAQLLVQTDRRIAAYHTKG